MKIGPRITSVGESGKKINQNKKDKALYSRICPDAPLKSIGTNFGLRVRLVDVIINCAKFYRNRLRGLDSMSELLFTL